MVTASFDGNNITVSTALLLPVGGAAHTPSPSASYPSRRICRNLSSSPPRPYTKSLERLGAAHKISLASQELRSHSLWCM
jgi:hypothetical protein